MKVENVVVLAGSLVLALGVGLAYAAPDASKAEAQIETNKCNKCHAPAKSKTGPSWKKIAAKYKDKPDAEESIVKQITTGPKVKLDDGTEEEHKIIKTKDPEELKNLAQWILSH